MLRVISKVTGKPVLINFNEETQSWEVVNEPEDNSGQLDSTG